MNGRIMIVEVKVIFEHLIALCLKFYGHITLLILIFCILFLFIKTHTLEIMDSLKYLATIIIAL